MELPMEWEFSHCMWGFCPVFPWREEPMFWMVS